MGRLYISIAAAVLLLSAFVAAGPAYADCGGCDRPSCDKCAGHDDCECARHDDCDGGCDRCRHGGSGGYLSIQMMVRESGEFEPVPGRCCERRCYEWLCCEHEDFKLLCPKPCKEECGSCKPKCKQDTCSTCKPKCKRDDCDRCQRDSCASCKPKCKDRCGGCKGH